MIVCIDTNVLLGMFGRSAPLLPIRQALLAGHFVWAVSTEILFEYEEVIAREIGADAAKKVSRFMELVGQTRGGIRSVSPTYRFGAISADPDDNKFSDCAIVADADFIITWDRHFESLRGSGYKPQLLTPEEFIRLLQER